MVSGVVFESIMLVEALSDTLDPLSLDTRVVIHDVVDMMAARNSVEDA